MSRLTMHIIVSQNWMSSSGEDHPKPARSETKCGSWQATKNLLPNIPCTALGKLWMGVTSCSTLWLGFRV